MSDDEWDQLLSNAPTIPFAGNLSRAVPKLGFDKSNRYLFTSTLRNHCNPRGVSCIYMSEDRATALAEYDKYYTDTGNHEPCLFYTGKFSAVAILDLGNPATMAHFSLTTADFFQAFRAIPHETPLEQLGQAVERQHEVCAIRFPSDAMHVKSAAGFNLAIFKQALVTPDSLRILDSSGAALEEWP